VKKAAPDGYKDTRHAVVNEQYFQFFPFWKLKSDCFNHSFSSRKRHMYTKVFASKIQFAVHLNNVQVVTQNKIELQPGTICEYLVTRFCIFCNTEPTKRKEYVKVVNVNVIALQKPKAIEINDSREFHTHSQG
jgi:hypothetical protein